MPLFQRTHTHAALALRSIARCTHQRQRTIISRPLTHTLPRRYRRELLAMIAQFDQFDLASASLCLLSSDDLSHLGRELPSVSTPSTTPIPLPTPLLVSLLTPQPFLGREQAASMASWPPTRVTAAFFRAPSARRLLTTLLPILPAGSQDTTVLPSPPELQDEWFLELLDHQGQCIPFFHAAYLPQTSTWRLTDPATCPWGACTTTHPCSPCHAALAYYSQWITTLLTTHAGTPITRSRLLLPLIGQRPQLRPPIWYPGHPPMG